MLNSRRQLDWDTIKADILTEFSCAMKISGYSEKFRLDVTQAAIVTYERRCAQADAGLAPLHRPRGWQREERRQAKAIALNCWYRPQNTLSASYLQTTLTQSSPKSFWSLLTSC